MAQLNLYLPDELAVQLRREARQAGIPLSRYVLGLLAPARGDRWPRNFFKETCGFLKGRCEEPADPAPEPVEGVD